MYDLLHNKDIQMHRRPTFAFWSEHPRKVGHCPERIQITLVLQSLDAARRFGYL